MSCYPDQTTFLQRAKQGNLVPVWRELLADMDTPVSAYQKLRRLLRQRAGETHTFLLESVEGGEKVARYSFLGGAPRFVFSARGRRVEITRPSGEREVLADVDPMDELRRLMSAYRPVPDPELPRFFGGAVGFLGYDAVAQFEKRVPLSPGEAEGPDLVFALMDTIVIFDHVRHTLKVVANVVVDEYVEEAYQAAVLRIDEICRGLMQPLPQHLIDARERPDPAPAQSNLTRAGFTGAVERAQEYIRAGDIIQVVLSQRFEVDYKGDPIDLYRAIRCINPSPYLYCLEFGGQAIVGSSPEVHVRCEEGKVEVRPIAGTRPRSADTAADRRLAEELLADPKERAEHIMLVDLARNDLGRVCTFGSVRVPELMVIERYSHVMHIVSDVVGQLAPGRDAFDVLKATFPAGTVSGAPKIRAMEIIAELENTRRGPYAGAVCYFSFTGNLDSCITIRTALLDGRKALVQAGAGIVADSRPDSEYEETCNKARGMLSALALSARYAEARATSEEVSP
jgi:anthranilate synthase component 1